ncbi:unnamed protein product [Rotaria sordida]|uniref:Anti-proliferative protein domain-containing protein n=1 Tax=Rotaria sordida TaxID=392033 RepID=A0A815K1L5_9BILA|nr:unnamed protein product [Rotaria sordida]CAF1387320.1 unnamed protein product [Rotaria sordida]CAF1448619.1 unnamed protein product [Rotaria sordida]CAF3635469.1 unnamed protein product [Rotaria sordida]
MTYPNKELHVACNYLLRLIKAHVELSNEQINLFKHTFHDILSKRFVNHWFPATPNRGSAYRCLQTKHWKDPVLKSIAERSCLPLHRYLPAIFTMWIDPGEVAVCFGDEGTWCPLYKHDSDGQIHQEYSDGEETASSLSSDDDLVSLTENVKTLNVNDTHMPLKQNIDSNISRSSSSSIESSSRTSSPFFNAQIQPLNNYHYSGSNLYSYHSLSNDWNEQQNIFWPQQQFTMSDSFLLYNQRENS